MSNSPLCTTMKLSPNCSSRNGQKLKYLAIHAFVGQVTAQRGVSISRFVNYDPNNGASCHYVVGIDGIGLGVPEDKRAWCTSSRIIDQQAITIETACDTYSPYAVRDDVYDRLIELVVDICKRNGKKKLLFLKTKEATEAYNASDDELLIYFHKWTKPSKACPGQWLISHMDSICEEVNARLNGNEPVNPVTPVKETIECPFKVRVTSPTDIFTTYTRAVAKAVCPIGVFTIVEKKNYNGVTCGKLKSGAGWIDLFDDDVNIIM